MRNLASFMLATKVAGLRDALGVESAVVKEVAFRNGIELSR